MTESGFAMVLRRERRRAGLSQYELAQRCGMRAEAISRLERGEREPRLTTIVRLAHGLEMTPAELLAAFTESR